AHALELAVLPEQDARAAIAAVVVLLPAGPAGGRDFPGCDEAAAHVQAGRTARRGELAAGDAAAAGDRVAHERDGEAVHDEPAVRQAPAEAARRRAGLDPHRAGAAVDLQADVLRLRVRLEAAQHDELVIGQAVDRDSVAHLHLAVGDDHERLAVHGE